MKLILYAILFFCPQLCLAQAQVFPTHLTLTEESPSSYINVKNVTDKPQTYRVELVRYEMSPDGTMKKSATFVSPLVDLIKFSPKKISVAPNEKQIVRVMMTSFEQLKEGDQYIHLHFLPVDETTSSETKKEKTSGFSLQARIAVAVPLVVRKGSGSFGGEFKDVKTSQNKNKDLVIALTLSNKNKFSLYGDLEIFAVFEKEEILIDKTVGLSSYLAERSFKKTIAATELKEKLGEKTLSKIKIQYHANPESPGPFDISQVTKLSEPKAPNKRR